MARIHGTDGRVYVNQYNLSGRANTIDLTPLMRPTHDVTAFEDAAETFVAGKADRGWEGSFRAASDFVAAEIDEILAALVAGGGATIPVWGFYFDGSAAGSRGYEGQGWLDADTRRAARNTPHLLDAKVTGGGPYAMGRAMKLNEATVITGTGNQTGQTHMAAGSGDRVLLVARITAVSGSGSVTFKLQESSDGSGDPYADAITATAMTAVGAQVATAVAGATLGPYWRINVSAFSGFTNVTARLAVAIIPGG